MDGESKCNCQRCGQTITFPIDLNNTETVCPNCGKETTLQVPRVRGVSPANQIIVASPYGDLGGLVLAGYLTAILLPPVGFIIGVVLLFKNRPASGICCIVLSAIIVLTGIIATMIFQ